MVRASSWGGALRAVAAVALISICAGQAAADETQQWTVAAYLSGDGDLGNAARGYAAQLARGAETSGWSVAIQLDQVDGRGECAAERRLVTQGEVALAAAPLTDGGVNMGSAETLKDFLRWAMSEAPAEKYALIIMGHGASVGGLDVEGGRGEWGVALDASSGGDALTAGEIAEAIQEALAGEAEERLAAIFLDSCYSGSLETAYELRAVGDALCASPDRMPNPGIPWDAALAEAWTAGVVDGAGLVSAVLRVAERSRATASELRLTGVRAAGMPEVSVALSELTGALLRGMPTTGPSITLARSKAHRWGPQREMCDARGLCEALVQSSDDVDVRRAAQRTIAAIDDVRISGDEVVGNDLGIFFPGLLGEMDESYAAAASSLARESGWAELISRYRGRLRNLLDRAVGGEDRSERHSAG